MGLTCTEKNLQTLPGEVESVLNEHPLTSISNDTSDFEPLTPNDKLIGEASPNQSQRNFRENEFSLRRKWRSIQTPTGMSWRK